MITRICPSRSLLGILLFALPGAAQDRTTLIEWTLEDPTWTVAAEPVDFREDSIELIASDYVPTILEFGLIGATTVEFVGPAGNVETTLYEMADSSASYGLFALERDWRSRGFELAVVGTEGYRIGSTLTFWQSKYVVRLDGSTEATDALGSILENYIVGQSRKAPVSLFLPADGLIAESEKYILTAAAFEGLSGLDSADLGFENSVEVSIAEYQQGASTGRLALLHYPTQQLAELHYEAWLGSRAVQLPSRRSGPLVAIMIQSDRPEFADSIMPGLNYQTEVTWTDTLPDPLTLPHMILTIFTFIGIALVFTLVVGLVFGGFRIYMKTHYPGSIFGREDEAELIQLKLYQSVTRKELNP